MKIVRGKEWNVIEKEVNFFVLPTKDAHALVLQRRLASAMHAYLLFSSSWFYSIFPGLLHQTSYQVESFAVQDTDTFSKLKTERQGIIVTMYRKSKNSRGHCVIRKQIKQNFDNAATETPQPIDKFGENLQSGSVTKTLLKNL